MKTTIGKLSVFLLLIAGIFGYLKTGVNLFQKIKNGAINLELNAIDRALFAEKIKTNRYPQHFKKFLSQNFETKSNKKVGTDPWGKDYHYKATLFGYTIVSSGPNQTFGDKDDIIAVRDKKDFNITVTAASSDLKAIKINQSDEKKPEDESKLIEELMTFLDVKKLERPFEEMNEEEIAQIIVKFLRDYGYE